MRRLSFLLLLAACDDGNSSARQETQGDAAGDAQVADARAPDAQAPDAGPTCAVEALYDPAGGTNDVFPDDFWTVSDPSTATGRRVAVAEAPWLAEVAVNYQHVFRDLDALDGFGTSAPIFLRFSGSLALPEAGVVSLRRLGEDAADPPAEIPFEIQLMDDGTTLVVDPLRPLDSGRRYAIAVGPGLKSADGGCVAPAAGFHAPEGVPADALVGATFTTQTVFANSQAVAENIALRRFAWDGDAQCEQERGRRHCERRFLASDYRGEDGAITTPRPKKTYSIPVSIWIPDGAGPWPVVIAGHGLSDSRAFGQVIDRLVGEPVAVVAIDSPYHGEHPGGASPNPVFLVRDLFAVDLAARNIDPVRLRDNLRTATFDKLQLLALLKQSGDLDGDGLSDIDTDHIAYLGLSLGGILGGEFLALADGIGAAALCVPGAELTRIMRDSDGFGPLVAAFSPAGASQAEVARIFGGIQTVIESGDPVNFARRILRDRLPHAGAPPHLLILMAVGDETVPNSSTASLARALELPILAPAALPWAEMEVVDADPLVANLEGLTAGLYQHVTVTYGNPPALREEPASHNNVLGSREGIRQISGFFDTWLRDEPVEIVVP